MDFAQAAQLQEDFALLFPELIEALDKALSQRFTVDTMPAMATTNDIIDITRKIYEHKIDFTTPMLDHLNKELNDRVLDAKRQTVFTIGSIQIDIKEYRCDGVTAWAPTMIVYGTMQFKEYTDRAATVTIRPDGHAWTKSSAWRDDKYAEFPDGAKSRVADQVKSAVLAIIESPTHWRILTREARLRDLRNNYTRGMSEAMRLLEDAEKALTTIEQEGLA